MRSRRRLALENLEERALLTTLYVNGAWADLDGGVEVQIGDSGVQATIGTDAFATIQAAINKAASVVPEGENADEIRITPGTYVETLTINKSLSLIGDTSGDNRVVIDVSGLTKRGGINIPSTASNVTLSGFDIVGSTENTGVRYGIDASGLNGLHITDVTVKSIWRTGINLNGVTNFSIDNATVLDTTGAGIFMTDVKVGTLSNITTNGNEWTGVGFSTYGKDHAIGVEQIVISGNNSFGEAATSNGGVMFEASRWDKDLNDGTGGFDMDHPMLISFSTNLEDGANVTFDFEGADSPLKYVITGAQDDGWPVRHNFYATLAQGLAAAEFDALPTHYTGDALILSPFGVGVGAPALSGSSTIDRGSTYTLTLAPAEDAGTDTEWLIDWGDGTTSTVASSETSVDHDYANAPNDYIINVTEIVAGLYTSAGSQLLVSVLNVAPTIAIINAPADPVGRGAEISLSSEAGGPDIDVLTYAWSVKRDGEDLPNTSDTPDFAFAPALPGVYVVTLTATGRFDTMATTTAEITVINAAPTAEITGAPADPVNRNQEVSLGANTNDPDEDDLTYTWSVTRNDELITEGGGANFTFAPALPGVYVVTLTVADPFGDSATDTKNISVVNAAPAVVITGAPADPVNRNQEVSLGANVNDPDEDALTYAWSVTREGLPIRVGHEANFTFAPALPGQYVVTLTVTDEFGDSAEDSLTITVVDDKPTDPTDPTDPGTPTDPTDPTDPGAPTDPGTPTDPGAPADPGTPTDPIDPVAPAVEFAPLPGSIMAGDVVNLAATATDSNPNTPLTYAWTITRDGVFMGAGDQSTLQYIPLFSGVYEATLVVSDGDGGVTTRSIQFEVQTNVPPAVEQTVQLFQRRVDVQIERQAQRVGVLAERFGENQPPIIQRMMDRMAQTQVRMQNLIARRMMILQRIFSRRGFR